MNFLELNLTSIEMFPESILYKRISYLEMTQE